MKIIFDFTTHESDELTRSIKKTIQKDKSDQHTRLLNQVI